MNAGIEPRRVSWRILSLGSTVWAPHGHGWPGIIIGLGKNRADNTVAILGSKREGRAGASQTNSGGANPN
jgi:hypothetical protein